MSDFPSRLRCIGIMTGTSMDGLDGVLAQINTKTSPWTLDTLTHIHQNLDSNYKINTLSIIENNQLRQAHVLGLGLAQETVKLVKKLLVASGHESSNIDLVATHGQTLFHHPDLLNDLQVGYTIQANNISYIAAHTHIDTVGNFRQKDMSFKGQGAPLVPFGHAKLFGQKDQTMALQNLGGIANLTLIENQNVTLGFDNAPGNIWIDTVVTWHTQGQMIFDQDGMLAKKGKPNLELVNHLLKHPYFEQKPPKSTGIEMFGSSDLLPVKKEFLNLSLEDAVATATKATSKAISQSYQKWVLPETKLDTIVVCGGGANNPTLLHWIGNDLDGIAVQTTHDYNIPPEAIEPVCFAILGASCKYKVPNCLSQVTGATQNTIGGEIAFAEG